jgi:uncharacterized protein (TIGR02266 family)
MQVAARALMHAVARRAQAGDPSARERVETLADASMLRGTAEGVLQQLEDGEARIWRDVFQMPCDDGDLVSDLRAIAVLYEEHASVLKPGFDPTAQAAAARTLAEGLERLLCGDEAVDEWSPWIARAFTLTFSLYQEVRQIAHNLRGPDGKLPVFPSAAAIARADRRKRATAKGSHSLSIPPPSWLASVPPPERTSGRPPSESATLVSHSAPPSTPPPDSSRRRFERLSTDLEVSLLSETNFYVGFTENLSAGGLFVATYLTKPLGSKVELTVRLPQRDDPLVLRGVVKWVRLNNANVDGHPGMGIEFVDLPDGDRAAIAEFLAKREPIFYDE